jgi:hypothetical protein
VGFFLDRNQVGKHRGPRGHTLVTGETKSSHLNFLIYKKTQRSGYIQGREAEARFYKVRWLVPGAVGITVREPRTREPRLPEDGVIPTIFYQQRQAGAQRLEGKCVVVFPDVPAAREVDAVSAATPAGAAYVWSMETHSSYLKKVIFCGSNSQKEDLMAST